jgi:hypothetical protein
VSKGVRGVVSQAVVDDAVRRAALSARPVEDPDVSDEGSPMVAFDPQALARVSGLYGSRSSQDEVIRAWHRALKDAIERGELEEGRALIRLRERLEGTSGLRLTVTEAGTAVEQTDPVPLEDDPWIAERNYFG